MIHATAIIDPKAHIAPDVRIGPYSVVGPGVQIGPRTTIGSHTVIHCNTKIGSDSHIYSFVSLGGNPQHLQYKGEQTYLEIGHHNIIREFCTLNRGTAQGGGTTRLGNHNLLMAYAHVAHDSVVGNEVILANNASLAGHVSVGNFSVISAFCGVHQFVRIGSYSFLGRAAKVVQDIPPYVLVTGNPGTPNSINAIGLKRRGFSEKTLRLLRKAYRVIYKKSLPLKQAIAALEQMQKDCPELGILIDMLKDSKRGIARAKAFKHAEMPS